jgi:hypothetical protein
VIHYRSAIAFERPLEFIDEETPVSAAPETKGVAIEDTPQGTKWKAVR